MTEQYYPKDLIINPTSAILAANTATDKNNFTVVVPNLKIDSNYTFQFQYVFEDGVKSDWSPGKFINTSTEAVPGSPSASVPSSSTGNIPVTLSTYPTNAKRVDIYVIGGSVYGTGKVVDSFLSAGTKTISIAEPGVYQVQLIAVTPSGINGTPSSTFTITVSANTVDTTVIPGAPSAVIVSGFNEPSDPLNRTGYANISWTAGSGAKGYSVGLWTGVPGSSDPVRQIDTNSTSVKIEGLFVGSSYYIRVKSFNEFNNLSAWVQPASNYPVTIPGTALVPGAVTISGTAAPKSIVVAWSDPASNADLVTSGGYYEVKLYTNSAGTGTPLETRKAWSNQASFSGLTTGTQYWVTVQPYTSGSTPVAGTITATYGPLVPTAIDNPDLKGDFILASNQLQVGGTSGANDIHLSAYTKTVGSISTAGRIYIGGPETSASVAVGLYNDSGTPFYADNLGRFSLGDKLTWSGNLATPELNVKGTIEVTGASTFSSYVIAGATNSAFIGIGYQVPYRLSSALQSGANGLTGIVLNSSGSIANSDWIKSDGTFRLANGALTFTGGVLTATGTIAATSLSASATLDSPLITGGTYRTSATVGNGSTAGIKIDTSGIYGYTASSATPNFSVSNTGILTANAGNIGSWVINSGKLASAAGSTPSIELDPLTPQIVIRGSGSYAGYNITLAAPTGITAGSTFAVTPAGYLTSTSGQVGGWTLGASSFTGGGTTLNSSGTISLTGGTVSGNGETFTAGNLTLNSGAITSNSTLFLTANDLYYDSNFAPTGLSYPTWVQGTNLSPISYYVGNRCTYNSTLYRCVQFHQSTGSTPNVPSTAKSGGYLWVEEANSLLYVDSGANVHIGERGTLFTSLGSPRNALSFRINTFDRGDGYYGRGYVLAALDTSEFKYSTSGSGITAPTVVVGFYGQLYNGRAFYYGSAGTSSAINTEVGGSIGDVYFSTV